MTDDELGRSLRLALEQRGHPVDRPVDPRSVEARLPQLLPAHQQDLLPALSYLLRTSALASVLAQPSGSDDGRLAARLMMELQAHYSPAICQRLAGVIQGLVGTPPQPQATAPAVNSAVTRDPEGDGGWLMVLLCFLIGVLGSGLLLLLWLQQPNRQFGSSTAAPPPVAAPAAPPPMPAETDAIHAAVTSIQELYAALSAKHYQRAATHFGPVVADQFDPTFFDQFERVSVADLRQISSTGSMLHFEGVVTFIYPNGDVQAETRTFTVDTRTDPPVVTSSEFGRVLQAR